jgi:hypothetical protein
MVLVNAGYPHANEFIRKLPAILARVIKMLFLAVFYAERLMGFEGAPHYRLARGAK